MRIHNLYADADGVSHFRDIEVELADDLGGGKMSDPQTAASVVFRRTPGDYELGWHNTPRRQYLVNLDAGVEITASDGEKRLIGAGEVILVEDVTGKGHHSKAVAGAVRHCLFIALE